MTIGRLVDDARGGAPDVRRAAGARGTAADARPRARSGAVDGHDATTIRSRSRRARRSSASAARSSASGRTARRRRREPPPGLLEATAARLGAWELLVQTTIRLPRSSCSGLLVFARLLMSLGRPDGPQLGSSAFLAPGDRVAARAGPPDAPAGGDVRLPGFVVLHRPGRPDARLLSVLSPTDVRFAVRLTPRRAVRPRRWGDRWDAARAGRGAGGRGSGEPAP